MSSLPQTSRKEKQSKLKLDRSREEEKEIKQLYPNYRQREVLGRAAIF